MAGAAAGDGATTDIRAVDWDGDLLLLDQRLLPTASEWIRYTSPSEAARAIADLVVRGAPAIGVTAAYAMALAARVDPGRVALAAAAEVLRDARPTAVNLAWAVERVLERALREPRAGRQAAALDEARAIHREDRAACAALARHGADLVPGDGPVEVMTHCNAGALATGGIGTALGVVRELAARGRLERLWACETRPVLQGARLTSWEGVTDGLPTTLVTDGAAASVIRSRPLAAVVVGADRIAADGSTANKVGTYPLAVLAARHGIPFLVAAPLSTVDMEIPDGSGIPIEERDGDEVRRVAGAQVAPAEVEVFNPAFDVTPPELIHAIVTERGAVAPPFESGLRAVRELI